LANGTRGANPRPPSSCWLCFIIFLRGPEARLCVFAVRLDALNFSLGLRKRDDHHAAGWPVAHGASWTFVAWGAVHGGCLVANQLWRGARIKMPGLNMALKRVPRAAACGCGLRGHVFDRAGLMGAVPRDDPSGRVEHALCDAGNFRLHDHGDVRPRRRHPLRGSALDLVGRGLRGRRRHGRRLGMTIAPPSTMDVFRYREYRSPPQARRCRWQWRPTGCWALGVATALSLSIFGMWQHLEFPYFRF
jgi:alginate O-acetyltransferase complex protein AlgI